MANLQLFIIADPINDPASEQISPDSIPVPSLSERRILKRSSSSALVNEVPSKILKIAGVTYSKELPEEAKKLYNLTKKLRRKVCRLTKTKIFDKKKQLTKISKEELVEKVTAPLNRTVANFVKTQIRLADVHPNGRRYTLDDKIMGLILNKQSNRAYKLFSKIFPMPSKKTIMALLNRIPIKAGYNEALFDNLKAKVKGLKQQEKLCVLMFDEISIEPHISLNTHSKEFEGFEDFGEKKSEKIADRALVFMIKGIKREWKQPLLYTFSSGPVKTIDLARIIKQVVKQCQDAGLKIIASVSDQGTNNQAVINFLMKSSIGTYVQIGDKIKFFKIN